MIEGDPPLLGRPEQDRLLAAPAVRVAVGQRLGMEQQVPLAEILEDERIGVAGLHAGELADPFDESSVVVHRRVDRQAVFASGHEVVDAVSGRRVHRAGPGVARHVVGKDQFRAPVAGVRVG